MNLLNTIKGLYEKVDPQDTGGAEEASMIKGQIKQIKHYIEGIEKTVAKDGDVEEWVQNKLTKATDYLKSVYGYKLGQDDSEEMDEEVELDNEELNLTEELEMAIEEGKRFGLTQSLLDAVKNVLAAETKPEEKLDPVDPKALKGKHADRKDKDIDNDGDVDDSDKYLHKRRQAVSKAMKESDDEEEKNMKKVKKDDDNGDKDDEKAAMAKNTDDDDEKSAEEKQKEKEYIAKKSDRKEPVDTKPTVKESLARRTLSRMMKDKENVKQGVNVPSHAERRAQMGKKERHIFTDREAAAKKQHELGGKAKIVTGTGKSAGKFLVVTEDLDLYEVTAYRVVNKKGTTIKSFGTDGSAASKLAQTSPDYKVVTDNVPFTPDKPKKNPSATAGKHGLGPSVAKHLAKKGMSQAMKKEEVELDEVDMGQAERGMRGQSKPTGRGYRVVNMKTRKTISTHDSQSDAMRVATRNDDYKVERIKEEVMVKEVHIKEAEMTPEQEKKREEIVMALKKKMPEFEAKYGDRAKEVMYATATKMAMKEEK